MDFLFLILLLSFIIFLFTLHILAKEDLIFVRRNVTMEHLFNLAFITAGVGLLSARVVHILLNPRPGFIHPLVFLLFPYFPGLSLVGGVIGVLVFLYIISKRKKLPIGRIFDFFAIAFLSALPVGYFGAFLLSGMSNLFLGLLLPGIFLLALVFILKVLLPLHYRGEIKDGSIGFLTVLIFSFTSLMAMIVQAENELFFLREYEAIIYFCLFLFVLALLVVQERSSTTKKVLKR